MCMYQENCSVDTKRGREKLENGWVSASMLKLLELEALEHSGQAKHKEHGTKKG